MDLVLLDRRDYPLYGVQGAGNFIALAGTEYPVHTYGAEWTVLRLPETEIAVLLLSGIRLRVVRAGAVGR